MSIREKINNFVKSLADVDGMLPYLYNAKQKSFRPGKDWVFYSGPVWSLDEPAAAVEAFLSGKWLSSGEHIARFEKKFSQKYDFSSSLMVNSGSSANLILISAVKKHLGWQDGDEIVVSCVGFPTTIAPIVQNNLKPVFVDINMEDLNFNLQQVEDVITDKTKAIFISPVLGNSPDMDVLVDIAERKNVTLLLDGCDSLGSKWKGRHLSDFAYATTCSFYPAHHITTGEGGMVSSNDDELIAVARSFAWWGRDCYCVGAANLSATGSCGKRFDKWIDGHDGVIDHKYLFTSIGYNVKPLDFQGAIGLEQLKKLDDIHSKRREAKNRLEAILLKYLGDDVIIPQELEGAETSWFGTPVTCHSKQLKQDLVAHLENNKVQTRNYFAGNILRQPAYSGLDDYKKYPNANKVLDHVFFIGAHPSYTEDTYKYVDNVLEKFVNEQVQVIDKIV